MELGRAGRAATDGICEKEVKEETAWHMGLRNGCSPVPLLLLYVYSNEMAKVVSDRLGAVRTLPTTNPRTLFRFVSAGETISIVDCGTADVARVGLLFRCLGLLPWTSVWVWCCLGRQRGQGALKTCLNCGSCSSRQYLKVERHERHISSGVGSVGMFLPDTQH